MTMPGVVNVLGPDDVKTLSKPFKPGRYAAGLRVTILEYATAVEKVRYVSEPVAMFAARTRAQAEDGAEAVVVDYEPLPPVADTASALGADAALLYEELGTNMPWEGAVSYGDAEGAFREADRVIKHHLKIHRYSSTPLEAFACIADYEPATRHLTTWCNAQSPEVIYEALTEALGLEHVRILIPDIGGGFGEPCLRDPLHHPPAQSDLGVHHQPGHSERKLQVEGHGDADLHPPLPGATRLSIGSRSGAPGAARQLAASRGAAHEKKPRR